MRSEQYNLWEQGLIFSAFHHPFQACFPNDSGVVHVADNIQKLLLFKCAFQFQVACILRHGCFFRESPSSHLTLTFSSPGVFLLFFFFLIPHVCLVHFQ